MLTLLAKIFAALNSESSTKQIAAAVSFALIVGLTPTLSLHNVLILALVFLLKVNLSSFFIAAPLFSTAGWALSGVSIDIGESLLTASELNPIWTSLYQLNLFKLAHLHNTYTLGSLALAILLVVPCFIASNYLIKRYRTYLKAFIEKFKVIQALKSSKFYQIYQSIAGV